MISSMGGAAPHENYAKAALDRECDLAAKTGHGRNEQLNRSAFSIGQLVGSGWIERAEAERRLMTSAEASGYVGKDGPAAARATIKSGLDKGEQEPRSAPEPGYRNGHHPAGPSAKTSTKPDYRSSRAAPKLSGVPLPAWTEPDETEWPQFMAIGEAEPPPQRDELPGRRHLYRRDGEAIRAKIKKASGTSYVDFYRVRRPADGAAGWQAKKPEGFVPAPYVTDPNPFAADHAEKAVLWPEGEKDVDTIGTLGFVGFTFGGTSDVIDGSQELVRGRPVVILADNDEPGRKAAAKKADILAGVASWVRIVEFSEVRDDGDVSDWVADHGGTAEALKQRIAAAPILHPARMWANGNAEASGERQWPEPKPLPSGLLPVASFDIDMIPVALGPWVSDIADGMQCPPDFIAASAVVGLSAVLGRKIAVRPQERTDWTEVPNLWGCIVGRPGAMKSPVMGEALKPLHRLESDARQANEHDAKRYALAMESFKIRKEDAQKSARATLKASSGQADITGILDIEEPEKPSPRRYVANDVTYEKLGEILVDNPNGVLAFRDELMSLLKTFDREENVAARGFFLTAWNGKDGYSFDRIIRGSSHIEAVCISMLGSTQPGRLAEYLTKAVKGGAGDDGLIQRFSLLVWPDDNREWREVDRYPESEPRRVAWEAFSNLDRLTAESVGAIKEEFDKIPYLRLTDGARDVFSEWRRDLENRLRTGGMHSSIESHLAKYRKLVPSLALINHLADGGAGSVDEVAMLRALTFAEYLETHAKRAYGSGLQAEAATAKVLLGRIRKGDLAGEFTARDVLQRDWSNLSDKDQVTAGLDLLEDLHWLTAKKVDTGGRPKILYIVNPRGLA